MQIKRPWVCDQAKVLGIDLPLIQANFKEIAVIGSKSKLYKSLQCYSVNFFFIDALREVE